MQFMSWHGQAVGVSCVFVQHDEHDNSLQLPGTRLHFRRHDQILPYQVQAS